MFGNSIDRMVTAFSAQFDEENGQLVYRKARRGAPIPVTAAERDAFIDDYRRAVRKAMWIFVAAIVIVALGLVGLLVVEDMDFDNSHADIIIYTAIIGMTVVFVRYTLRLYKAPAQQLHRLPVGPERTRAELRSVMLKETDFARLAGTAALGAYCGWRATTEEGFRRYFSIVLCIALIGLAVLQAVRKLLYDRANPTP